MTLPPETWPTRVANLHTIVGLVVIWLGLSRIGLPETIAAFAVARVHNIIASGARAVAVIAILTFRWHVLLPSNPSVRIRFVFGYRVIGYMLNVQQKRSA